MSEKKVSLGTVICLIIIFVLIMCLAGMWYYYTHIKDVDNGIKNNEIELDNNDLNDENVVQNDEEKEEDDEVDDELDEKIAGFIIENYLDLWGRKSADYRMFLEELNLVDKVEFNSEETIKIADGRDLWKTNIKYNDFKNALLTYMSLNCFEVFISNSFVENNGYLYTEPAGASGFSYDINNTKLKEQNNNYYVFTANATCDEPGGPTYPDIEAVIVKENGRYVFDKLLKY